MCTSYLPHYERQRAEFIDYKKDDFWALDNLYVFLSLELGIGFFFYTGSIFTIVLFTSLRTLILLRRRYFDKVKSLIPSLTIFYILIFGNWGAIALPFNPEKFLFLALCLNCSKHCLSTKHKTKPARRLKMIYRRKTIPH